MSLENETRSKEGQMEVLFVEEDSGDSDDVVVVQPLEDIVTIVDLDDEDSPESDKTSKEPVTEQSNQTEDNMDAEMIEANDPSEDFILDEDLIEEIDALNANLIEEIKDADLKNSVEDAELSKEVIEKSEVKKDEEMQHKPKTNTHIKNKHEDQMQRINENHKENIQKSTESEVEKGQNNEDSKARTQEIKEKNKDSSFFIPKSTEKNFENSIKQKIKDGNAKKTQDQKNCENNMDEYANEDKHKNKKDEKVKEKNNADKKEGEVKEKTVSDVQKTREKNIEEVSETADIQEINETELQKIRENDDKELKKKREEEILERKQKNDVSIKEQRMNENEAIEGILEHDVEMLEINNEKDETMQKNKSKVIEEIESKKDKEMELKNEQHMENLNQENDQEMQVVEENNVVEKQAVTETDEEMVSVETIEEKQKENVAESVPLDNTEALNAEKICIAVDMLASIDLEVDDLIEVDNEQLEEAQKIRDASSMFNLDTESLPEAIMEELRKHCLDSPASSDQQIIDRPKSKTVKKTEQTKYFRKQLIRQVRKHRVLYDKRHKNYENQEYKQNAWLQISQILKVEYEICQNLWLDLRYAYQRYVRKMRKFLLTRNVAAKRRPTMAFENEMNFLWRHIGQGIACPRSYLPTKAIVEQTETTEPTVIVPEIEENVEDDDVVLLDNPVEVIDLDSDDEEVNATSSTVIKTKPKLCTATSYQNLKISDDIKRLVSIIQDYPELYDSEHRFHNDYKRKGMIWSAIANEMNDKATKLMKCWLLLVLRFEWETFQYTYHSFLIGPVSEIQTMLSFLLPYFMKNTNSVYKMSRFLIKEWHEPIEHFKNIYSLLATMRKYPAVIYKTEEWIKTQLDSRQLRQYKSLWVDISIRKGGDSAGRCEVTWLLLRSFYWELINMRRDSYQLQDKWYFESIISDLYKIAQLAKVVDEKHTMQLNKSKGGGNAEQELQINGKHYTINKRAVPLSKRPKIRTPLADTTPQITTTTSTASSSLSLRTIPYTTVIQKKVQPPSAIQYPTVIQTKVPTPGTQFVMPKITAACSLATNDLPNAEAPASVPNVPAQDSYKLSTQPPQLLQAQESNDLNTVQSNGNQTIIPLILNGGTLMTVPTKLPTLIPKPTEMLTANYPKLPTLSNSTPINTINLGYNTVNAQHQKTTPPTTITPTVNLTTLPTTTATTIKQVYPTTYIVKKNVQISQKTLDTATTAAPLTGTQEAGNVRSGGYITAVPLSRLQGSPPPPAPAPTPPQISQIPATLAGTIQRPFLQQNAVSIAPMNAAASSQQPVRKTIVLQPRTPLLPTVKRTYQKKSTSIVKVTTAPSTSTTTTQSLSVVPISSLQPTLLVRPAAIPAIQIQQTQLAAQQKPTRTLPLQPEPPIFPPLPTLAKPNTTQSATQPSTVTSNTGPSIPNTTESPNTQVLNSNEVIIELIAMSKGNFLVVQGPMLKEKFMLSMTKTARFIREIISIPQLHNKNPKQPDVVAYYWNYIANNFSLPANICRACWNFLSENFQHFPQIAPMSELMRPLKIPNLEVWTTSFTLFKNFNEHAIEKGWLQYAAQLPALISLISRFPSLFKDVLRPGGKVPNKPMNLCENQAYEYVQDAFKNITDIPSIWHAFKEVFLRYMTQIEYGVENQWPRNWWSALAKCTFLYEARYNDKQPYYHIVRYKIIEELERCTNFEAKMSQIGKKKDLVEKTYTKSTIKKTPRPSSSSRTSQQQLAHSEENTSMKLKTRGDLDAYELILAIRRHPQIYEKVDVTQKRIAWTAVAKELRTSITTCRLTFQYALKTYRKYKRSDTDSGCPITQKYFKYFEEIDRIVSAQQNKQPIRQPSELNESLLNVGEPSEIAFPEYYVPEITMTNNPPSLVMKNWSYAVGTMKRVNLEKELRTIFAKYRPLAK